MELGLKGKAIFVSGSSKGLGLAVAACCKAEGARVIIGSRDPANLEPALAELQAIPGGEAMAAPLDMTNRASIEQWVAAGMGRYGTVDGVLVNAGGPPPGRFDNFEDAQWQSGFELTLLSAVRLIRACLPGLRQQGGSILALTSVTVREPADVLLLSNVMRSGVTSLVKSLSRDLAKDNIRANCLMPGYIHTGRIDKLDEMGSAALGISIEEQRARQHATIPLGRYGKPVEFGRVAAFLLSPAASYITGVSMAADGGMVRGL